jgi:hypothetical protein
MTLTEQQAFDAMVLFSREYWDRGARASDDLAELLSSLDRGVWSDGGTADPAIESDWESCVRRIQAGLDPYNPSGPT